MDKPEVCEWSDCKNDAAIFKIVDGEKYWFCGHECAEEFWKSIQDRY